MAGFEKRVIFARRRKAVLAAVSAVLSFSGMVAEAATWTWLGPSPGTQTNPNTGNWNLGTNWGPSGLPTSVAATELWFGGSGANSYTSTNDRTSVSFGVISLNSTSTLQNTIAGNEPFRDADISIVQNGSGAFLLSTNFIFMDQVFTLGGNGGGVVTINSTIAGESNGQSLNNLIKNGLSTYRLTGSSSADVDVTTLNAGLVIADFTNNTNAKMAGGNLTLAGGNLSLVANTSANATESFDATALNAGASTLTVNGAASRTTTLNLNQVTRAVGGTMNVVYGATGTNRVLTDTDNGTGNILGGWATFNGTDWAVSAASASDTVISALGSYTNDTWSAGTNTTVTAAGANPPSGSTTNTLRFNATAAKALTLAGTNTVNSGGILITPGVGNNAITITGGNL
ncbi:MAG: hypothetical protein H7Z14_11025, partial [Anaerolineae bacterium]|nr:hypothetical protein [Phycisphaerae bacterium]